MKASHSDLVGAGGAAGTLQSVPLRGGRQLAGEAVAARLVYEIPAKDRRIVPIPPPCQHDTDIRHNFPLTCRGFDQPCRAPSSQSRGINRLILNAENSLV